MQRFISGAGNVLAHSTPTLDRLGESCAFLGGCCVRSQLNLAWHNWQSHGRCLWHRGLLHCGRRR